MLTWHYKRVTIGNGIGVWQRDRVFVLQPDPSRFDTAERARGHDVRIQHRADTSPRQSTTFVPSCRTPGPFPQSADEASLKVSSSGGGLFGRPVTQTGAWGASFLHEKGLTHTSPRSL